MWFLVLELHGCSLVRIPSYVMEDTCDEERRQGCTLTCIIQMGSSVMLFLAKDIMGISSLLQKPFLSLVKYLKS